jgi:hypothetical protein
MKLKIKKLALKGKLGAKKLSLGARLRAKLSLPKTPKLLKPKKPTTPPTCIWLLLFLPLLGLSFGCSMQPSRSQTQKIKFQTLNVFLAPDHQLPAPDAVPRCAGDFLTLNMMIETAGNESNAQEASVTPTLNLPVGDTGVSALGQMLGGAVVGGIEAAKEKANKSKKENDAGEGKSAAEE